MLSEINVIDIKKYSNIKFLIGRNQDGVITRCGIISHQVHEEIIPEVFVHELHGNEAQTLQEHFPKLR